MPGIAEGLPRLLGSLAERGEARGVSPEVVDRVKRWVDEGELPSLAALAELIDQAVWRGFAELEWRCEPPEEHPRQGGPTSKVSPRLVVTRLDIGLRALRAEKGVTQAQVAEATGLANTTTLSSWERVESGERPSVEELDRLLRVLGASYLDLEEAIKNPFAAFRAADRRLQREKPIVIDGEIASDVISERFDLGLRILRLRRGWGAVKLAEESGLTPGRIQGLETRGQGAPPSEEEVEALLRALGASAADLEEAARNPLAEVSLLRREVRKLARRVESRGSGAAKDIRLVAERLDLVLKMLRIRRGWSQRELAEASGLSPARVQQLDTWGGQGPPASEEELEALLGALGATPAELKEIGANPLKELRRREREWKKVKGELEGRGPIHIGGARVPAVVTERFDLALQVLRSMKGWSRRELGEKAGLPPERITALETWGRKAAVTEEEAERLLVALGADVQDLERAARWPLRSSLEMQHELLTLRRRLTKAEAALDAAREEAREARGEFGVPEGPVFEAAWRTAQSLARVRKALGAEP